MSIQILLPPREKFILQRRLAAILIADVVDYSRLMGEDETRMLAALTELRQELFEPVVVGRGGRVIKRMGDGWIVEFANVSDAVASAVEVQESLSNHEFLRMRVGIHSGDVTFQDDDVYGDGINVAARLEALAEPGQVLISDTAHHSLDGKAGMKFSGGDQHVLKNIARPIGVWQWSEGADVTVWTPITAALPDKPSIAVLPFDNMSSDPEHQYFAEGIAENIITALSRISRMRVIARNSTFVYKGKAVDLRQVANELGVRYVLEGSIRAGGNRLRITAQLIDASDGSHVWADRFDRTIDDIFDIQDEITKEIVTALQVKLTDGEVARVMSRGTNNIEAWQLCVRATELLTRFDATGYLEARELAEKAVAHDPDYSFAWAILGNTYWWDGRLRFTGNTEEKFTRAAECAERALAIDDTVTWAIGLSIMTASEIDGAEVSVALARRGFELNPGSADVRVFLGYALTYAGEYQKALDHFRAAISLNPFYPSWYRNGVVRNLMILNQFEEALALADETLRSVPEHLVSWIQKAYMLSELGRPDEAKHALREIRRLAPNLRIGNVLGILMIHDVSVGERILNTLRNAGLAEE